jgi:hypothetical protein
MGLAKDNVTGEDGDGHCPPLVSKGLKDSKNERVFLHGTLFVYVRRAHALGRSRALAATDGEPVSKSTSTKVKATISKGMRFVGKKMINAVRATNHVRS